LSSSDRAEHIARSGVGAAGKLSSDGFEKFAAPVAIERLSGLQDVNQFFIGKMERH
jgi:hypothetical protein